MEEVESIVGRAGQCSACRPAAAGWRAWLVGLSIAGLGSACPAADSMDGLGSAFRPPSGADARVEGNGENLPGLRVVVSSVSRSVASIDGRIVRVGDTVNGMRVTQINQQGVVLTGEDGASERLMINPSVVKRKLPVKATRNSNGARQ